LNKEKIIIDSTSTSFLSIKEIIRYKSLLNNLARRDFLVRYKQAFVGILWALIKPLINILVFGYIATKINSTVNAANNFVFVAAAMLLWQLFANVFNDVSNSILGNSNLFSKVYFPKIIIPISSILVCLVDFIISLVILIVLFFITGQEIRWQFILAPFFIFQTLINGLGLGLYFATINVKYRDIKFIVPVLLQLGLYITPVIFPTEFYFNRLPDLLKFIYALNPMLSAIDGFKYAILGTSIHYDMLYFYISTFCSLIFLFIGIKYFYKFERNFVDYI